MFPLLKIDFLRQQHIRRLALMGMLMLSLPVGAQFAPPAEMPGSTAISADSPLFVAWASACNLEPGLMDITNESLGLVTYGLPEYATQMSDNKVVSLGDRGVATCFFEVPIANGAGWDFAVFENSFDDLFLELAFVEVSSDGANFVRFEATSLTQTETQIETFGILDATRINNLAGKYRGGYGVPFDLQELDNIQGLDINAIIAVRIIDVVGNIQLEYSSEDALGHPINDPWPTAFETGGFDLDAIGVIHNQGNTAVDGLNKSALLRVFPNPVQSHFYFESDGLVTDLTIINMTGKQVFSSSNVNRLEILSETWPSGIYIVKAWIDGNIHTLKLVK